MSVVIPLVISIAASISNCPRHRPARRAAVNVAVNTRLTMVYRDETRIITASEGGRVVVAERLGDTTPSLVLNVYGHVTERMQEQVTAVLDRCSRNSRCCTTPPPPRADG